MFEESKEKLSEILFLVSGTKVTLNSLSLGHPGVARVLFGSMKMEYAVGREGMATFSILMIDEEVPIASVILSLPSVGANDS